MGIASLLNPQSIAIVGASEKVTGQRFIAVEWDESLGTDPATQAHAPAAWPQLAKPFSKMQPRR